MPKLPLRPCNHPGCPELTARTYCPAHEKQRKQRKEMERGNSKERGYDYHWQQVRKIYLAEHPLCVKCLIEKRIVKATIVDHITPHKGDRNLMYDENNLQALCKHHHDQKTSREGGRWF